MAIHRTSPMDPIELWISDNLIEHFDRIRILLDGEEVGRHPHPEHDDLIVVEMRMFDAPLEARRMELTIERVEPEDLRLPSPLIPTLRVQELRWLDEEGLPI
ncbi:hypothetical protein [Kitasatospora phosalacinea]|uniref:Uncharacterized protein n=1 Tax=Kitasatospora phosalacinea TaxID=2065 RepID=A0ABW6GRE6_9ACTN